MARAPHWSKKDRLFSFCFDEMHIDRSADVDKLLDQVVGPGKEANILTVGNHTFGFFYLHQTFVISVS